MIVFNATTDIGRSLWQLVQCWIVAERLGHRLIVKWDGLPPDRIQINPFFDANRFNTSGAFQYVQGAYREEKNHYLLLYYYRRIFAQILLLRPTSHLSTQYIRIVFWGDDALRHSEKVLNHHRYSVKEVQRFGSSGNAPTTATESWHNFLQLRECQVIVAARSLFIDAVLRTATKKKEFWAVNGIDIVCEK